MSEKTFKVFGILWDTDYEPVDLPEEVNVTISSSEVDLNDDELVSDFISDWLSDEYGFCHYGFDYKEL